ncbi:hypothetical protein F5882DRAFT_120812 [Hyaloscypha sp. PMI_1271]|nr:hypothetical protein F5882DRAFT_120812 [Hyaloscypha sp. PMI_1271]
MASKSAQKNLTSQFMSITGVNEKLAQRLLKGSNWKLEQACDRHSNATRISISPSRAQTYRSNFRGTVPLHSAAIPKDRHTATNKG